MKATFSQVGLTVLTIIVLSSAASIKNPKIQFSFFNRNRGDRRTEETTTIKTYQPKYKTLSYFRQLFPNSTFMIPTDAADNSPSSPPKKSSRSPSSIGGVTTDSPFKPIFTFAEEPSDSSFSESISTLSQPFSNSFNGIEDSSTSFSPTTFSSFDSTSHVTESTSTTPSSSFSMKLPSSIFNMSNLLRPSNSMTNFFKTFSRNPKAALSSSSIVNPNPLSIMKPPSSVMKPPSPSSFSSIIAEPSDSFSSFSSSSLFPSQASNFPEESTSLVSHQTSDSSANPTFSFDSSFSHFPEDVSLFFATSTESPVSSNGSAVIVAASNPTEGSSPPSNIPKSFSTSIYSSSSDSSINGDYNFSFQVNHTFTKQDFGHSENRVGNNTQGRYDVVLPDGRRQIVDYHVLNNRYFADVSFNREPAIPSTPSISPLITNAKIEENMEFPI